VTSLAFQRVNEGEANYVLMHSNVTVLNDSSCENEFGNFFHSQNMTCSETAVSDSEVRKLFILNFEFDLRQETSQLGFASKSQKSSKLTLPSACIDYFSMLLVTHATIMPGWLEIIEISFVPHFNP
jgi:hypothetical protein